MYEFYDYHLYEWTDKKNPTSTELFADYWHAIISTLFERKIAKKEKNSHSKYTMIVEDDCKS